VPASPRARADRHRGLATLRRLGAVSDLLFLFETEAHPISQLREAAERLGVSVQAASHTFRSLRGRGLVEIRGGLYRPTVRGVDWLHGALGSVRDDLAERLDRLHIVRTTRAIAAAPLRSGEAVALEIVDGRLTARHGPGRGSRGRARSAARAGEIVEVGELAGIVPLPLGHLWVAAVPADRLGDPSLRRDLARAVAAAPPGLLFAFGLEADHLLARVLPRRPRIRFGVAAAIAEATRLGVDCTLVSVDRELPRVFEALRGPDVPPLEFLPIGGAGGRPGRVRRQRVRHRA